jgi:polyhydroxyalkanoate synthesis regulator phasin
MKKLDISENTSIGLPLRNLIGLISAILIGAWFAFGVIERLNKLETADTLFQADLLKKAEQEPKNLEMYMLIEHLAGQIESIEEEINNSRYNKVNIDHLKEQVDLIQKEISKLRNGGH